MSDELLKNEKPTHIISACYYPGRKKADLTYENIETGKKIGFEIDISEENGDMLAEVVPACIYWGGKNKPKIILNNEIQDIIGLINSMIDYTNIDRHDLLKVKIKLEDILSTL